MRDSCLLRANCLCVCLRKEKDGVQTDSERTERTGCVCMLIVDGCVLLTVCFSWFVLCGQIWSTHPYVEKDTRTEQEETDRSEEERWKLYGGTFIETERVSEAALPPAP